MFLITSLLFGVLLAANGCPLDLVNCTIPYDDLNISTVVIIDATQYCHVDNCTVKMIKTGNELNIAYHNDQYYLSCTTTTLQLLEVNDNLCEQNNNKVAICILDSIASILLVGLNISIASIIIKHRQHSSLSIRFLLAATVMYVFGLVVVFMHSLAKFILKVPNATCITLIMVFNVFCHCGKLIECELYIVVFHSFYRCYKLYPPLSEKLIHKLFWISLVVAFFIAMIIDGSRGTVVALLKANYLNYDGFCISIPTAFTVTPITQYISIAMFIVLLMVEISFIILNGSLFYVLSKKSISTEARSRQTRLIKIIILLISSSGMSAFVYIVTLGVYPDYSFSVSIFASLCERCFLLYILSNAHGQSE